MAPPNRPLAPRRNAPLHSIPTRLARAVQGSFWAMCGLTVVAVLLVVGNLLAFNAWWDTPVGSGEAAEALDAWVRVEDALQIVGSLSGVVGLVVFVLLVIWANRAHEASQELWSGERSWTSGWSVGGWFIPLANVVIPKLVLDEVDRIASAPRRDCRADEAWRASPTAVVGWVWWIAVLSGATVHFVGNVLGSDPGSSAGEVRLGYVCNAVGLTAVAVGMAAGALFVRRLSSRLTAAGLAGTADSSDPDGQLAR